MKQARPGEVQGQAQVTEVKGIWADVWAHFFSAWTRGQVAAQSYIHLPSHILMPASPTQRLACGSRVLVQMACGIRKPVVV